MFCVHYREIKMPATFDDLYEKGIEKMMNANVSTLRIATLPWSQAKDLYQKPKSLLQWMNGFSKEVRMPPVSF
jgi:hypothetical protein